MARHVESVHEMDLASYYAKHNITNTRTCHCGKEFENKRYPGGPNAHGRAQMHCSPQCNQLANNMRRNYGIEPEVYWEHLRKGCAICGSHVSMDGKRKHAADHDHKTGKFRGVLCNSCNSGLGYFQDNPELLQKAIQYLSR